MKTQSINRPIVFEVFFLLLFLLPLSTQAAYILPFNDSVNYWPGFSSGTGDDNVDVVGVAPHISGGHVSINDHGYIDQITFTHTDGGSTSPDIGDLFLDLDSNGYWDYVVDVATQPGWTAQTQSTAAIYSFDTNEFAMNDAANYVYGGSYWGGGYRPDHPVGVKLVSGFGTDTGLIANIVGPFVNNSPVVFSFANLFQLGTDPLTIGFAASCANDTIFTEVVAPVPEPTTMLLFGTGLVGLACLRGKRKKE